MSIIELLGGTGTREVQRGVVVKLLGSNQYTVSIDGVDTGAQAATDQTLSPGTKVVISNTGGNLPEIIATSNQISSKRTMEIVVDG